MIPRFRVTVNGELVEGFHDTFLAAWSAAGLRAHVIMNSIPSARKVEVKIEKVLQ